MKIITAADCPQRSEEWQRLHIGRPTASMFAEICTPMRLEFAKGHTTPLYKLAAERLLQVSFGKSLDGLQWVEVGRSEEPRAVQQYEMLNDVRTVPVSFIMTDDEKVGCSPDALVIGDERHGVEIKSLFPPKMIRLLMEGIDSEHRVQVLGQMWVGEFTTNDYFCYNEATPPFFKRWHRAEVADDIAKVASHVTRFCDLLDACVEKMNATGFFTKREQPATAQDQFVEQAERDLAAFIHIADVEQWKEVYAREIGYLDPERREKVLGMADYRRAFLAAGTP